MVRALQLRHMLLVAVQGTHLSPKCRNWIKASCFLPSGAKQTLCTLQEGPPLPYKHCYFLSSLLTLISLWSGSCA